MGGREGYVELALDQLTDSESDSDADDSKRDCESMPRSKMSDVARDLSVGGGRVGDEISTLGSMTRKGVDDLPPHPNSQPGSLISVCSQVEPSDVADPPPEFAPSPSARTTAPTGPSCRDGT